VGVPVAATAPDFSDSKAETQAINAVILNI
jgi:hypothetical protein